MKSLETAKARQKKGLKINWWEFTYCFEIVIKDN